MEYSYVQTDKQIMNNTGVQANKFYRPDTT